MSNVVAISEHGSGVPDHTKGRGVKSYYGISLLWLSLFFAIIAVISNITMLLFVDLIHGNPYRPKSNAIEMMWLFSISEAIIAIIGCFLVFGLPQLIHAFLHDRVKNMPYPFSFLIILSSIPIISVLTWYCWEYLTPTDFNLGINEGPEWEPYKHGITLRRYLSSFAFQLPVSIYSLLYCEPNVTRISRKCILVIGSLAATCIGIGWGYRLAVGQYVFLGG